MILRGKILYRGEILEAGIEFDERILRVSKELSGKAVRGIILPAAIDVHVHFRDFREKHKETIESGSLSALHGGICLAIDQPNCKPAITDEEAYFERVKKAEKKSHVDYALNLGLTEENSGKIEGIISKICERGYFLPAIGEVFLQHDSMQVSYDTLEKVKDVYRLSLHAEDAELIACNEVPNFKCRPPEAEIEAVKKCVKIGSFHFCHVSTIDALNVIAATDSSSEVTPHHLLLSTEDSERLNGFVNVNPPLRSKENVLAMLENIDLADVIASDHAPHTPEEKKDGMSGFPGVETLYPLMLNLVRKGAIGLKTVVERLSTNPALIFSLRGYGGIEVGNYANLAVFDFSKVEKIKAEKLHSLAGWTPYEGFEAVFPTNVFIRGVEAISDGEVLVEPGFGEVLRSKN
ncbi:MAG: dihydroorotase [Archaeoglobales archaeon]|nr:MAG: dihydroorotase [Archaeoglobales archaeon]